ncbi:MAG: hypothetical protein M1837_003185 [Sclerophora amabilis]|nr:MAG: hypothetical protein M1837_003185 [Sclerophora amabilis]
MADPGSSNVAFASGSSSVASAAADYAASSTSQQAFVVGSPSFVTSLQQIKSSAFNASSYLTPSPMDLVLVIPRMARRAGNFALFTVPEQIDAMLGGAGYGRSFIAEPTVDGVGSSAVAASAGGFAQVASESGAGAAGGVGDASTSPGGFHGALSFNNVRGFGGIFSYMTSKWALTCFTVAIILNRTQIYASARRHLHLNWRVRLLLRIALIALFSNSILWLLEAMRCQTSPNFPLYRYNDPEKTFERDFAGGGGALYWLSSVLLPWQDDKASCAAARMVPSSFDPSDTSRLENLRGSLSTLWPLFQNLCLSQFIETLSCAVQGRPVMAETGMTIFEHSLAFAEAEALISNELGWGSFGSPTHVPSGNDTYKHQALTATTALSRSAILNRLNTPPEVLLIGLISSLSHLTSHVLAVLGMQGRFRLISTGVWGMCFMGAFVWSVFSFSAGPNADVGIMRFPTVCIVGFIPHLLILVGICVCASIYILALLLSALSPPAGLDPPSSLRQRITMAHENLQVNIQFSTIRISMHEDFYTTLLKVGFTALTAASEAVFLNEGNPVAVRRWTWLEEERMREVESNRNSPRGSRFVVPTDLKNGGGIVADGVGLAEEDLDGTASFSRWKSGYGKERTTKSLKKGNAGKSRLRGDGVGAAERTSRWIMAWELFRGIFWLLVGWVSVGLSKVLDMVGITWKPRWLRSLSRRRKVVDKDARATEAPASQELEFWLLSDDGELKLPEDRQVDVEAEMRRRLTRNHPRATNVDENTLDENIYGWWKQGGWFGELDASGTYEPEKRDDDTTSMISMADSEEENGWDTDREDNHGRRTPTQDDPNPRSREGSPFIDSTLDAYQLARLLDPQDAEKRQEARILAHHLNDSGIMTRSRYQKSLSHERAKVLTSTRYRPSGLARSNASKFPPSSRNTTTANSTSNSNRLTLDEETAILEHLILSRRATFSHTTDAAAASSSSSRWADGAEGLGSGGPQCVVCQSSPRTILVWPCRCLSLCEECRVSLAMNNFGNCVCCRRDVVAFSRIYAP